MIRREIKEEQHLRFRAEKLLQRTVQDNARTSAALTDRINALEIKAGRLAARSQQCGLSTDVDSDGSTSEEEGGEGGEEDEDEEDEEVSKE